MSAKSEDGALPWHQRLSDEQREYLKGDPVKHEPTCGLEALFAQHSNVDLNLTFHALPDADACQHQWKGWREFDGGRGGEQVCNLCGMGAMAHSLRTGP